MKTRIKLQSGELSILRKCAKTEGKGFRITEKIRNRESLYTPYRDKK